MIVSLFRRVRPVVAEVAQRFSAWADPHRPSVLRVPLFDAWAIYYDGQPVAVLELDDESSDEPEQDPRLSWS